MKVYLVSSIWFPWRHFLDHRWFRLSKSVGCNIQSYFHVPLWIGRRLVWSRYNWRIFITPPKLWTNVRMFILSVLFCQSERMFRNICILLYMMFLMCLTCCIYIQLGLSDCAPWSHVKFSYIHAFVKPVLSNMVYPNSWLKTLGIVVYIFCITLVLGQLFRSRCVS